MKKLIVIIVGIFILNLPLVHANEINLPKVTNHEKVKVYLFWGSWCFHCHNFLEYFSEIYDKYTDYFYIVPYQLDSDLEIDNQDNQTLFAKVREHFAFDENAIPFVVIGDWYQKGFSNDGTAIIEEALRAYQDPNYRDIVKVIIGNNLIMGHNNSFEDTLIKAGLKESIEENLTDEQRYVINGINNIISTIINIIKSIFSVLLNII